MRSASTATASNEATGVGGHSHSDATVAMSGTTLVRHGPGGGTIGSSTAAGGGEGGPETLVGSGSARSPSPSPGLVPGLGLGEERERERDEHGYLVDRKV